MRLLMMGTGPFAVPTFARLYETRHEVVALVTAPMRYHRGRPVPPISNIREIAEQHATPIFDPESINTPEAQTRVAEFRPDLLIVCDYGQILAPATLATARHGGINLHASLLPQYRGAAPINWAIYNGDTETGVTVIHMSPQIDAGPCIAQTSVAIGSDETAAEVEMRLAELGAGLIAESIDLIEQGRQQAIPQDGSKVTGAPRLKKTHGIIDWNRSALAIKNHIRALEPWPRTYTYWHRATGPAVRLILGPAKVEENRDPSAAPGTVLEASDSRLVIAAGEGALVLESLQPAGKRWMKVDEFLRGHPIHVGDRFGPGDE